MPHIQCFFKIRFLAQILNQSNFDLQSFNICSKNYLQLEGIYIRLVLTSPFEVDEHVSVLRDVSLDIRLYDIDSVVIELPPGIELVGQMVLDGIGHASVFSMIFKAPFAKINLFFQTVESSNLIFFVAVFVAIDAHLIAA
jgi:hypothetical protein